MSTMVGVVKCWSHCAGPGRNRSLLAMHCEDHTDKEARYAKQEGRQSRMSWLELAPSRPIHVCLVSQRGRWTNQGITPSTQTFFSSACWEGLQVTAPQTSVSTVAPQILLFEFSFYTEWEELPDEEVTSQTRSGDMQMELGACPASGKWGRAQLMKCSRCIIGMWGTA